MLVIEVLELGWSRGGSAGGGSSDGVGVELYWSE